MAQIVDHEERRGAIIAAATELILSGGFGAATMRTIAARAGYANGALKYYFPGGKSEIIAAIFTNTLREIESMAGTQNTGNTSQDLRHYLRSWFPRSVEELPSGRLLIELWGHSLTDESLRELYSAHLAHWGAQIAAQIEAAHAVGAVLAAPPFEDMASEYISFTMGTAVMNLMFPDGSHLSDIEHYLDGVLLRLGTPDA
ncbi:TetR/AcrR family transcriptional regulator [Leucobacter insecticola]|uniref:TetR/AcrR family transcriptional regulator n=1 Tax=Leucobacter insecticola TaxID=2714934 RepID=A0A6G8FIJ8_9MICO|nr:TetR/AcrR family transcriptional regulator [Leucobacter insecticola]QIM16195.1 TetR/AcrR family transcriptional regulator [Leucobacter insecticola]